MRRSLAAFAAATLLASSMPAIGFAEESAVDPTETTESSVSSSRPCEDLTGLLKAQCIRKHRPQKKDDNDRVKRQTSRAVLDLIERCKAMEGAERIRCMRLHGKAVKKIVRKAVIRTVRGKKIEASASSESSESSED